MLKKQYWTYVYNFTMRVGSGLCFVRVSSSTRNMFRKGCLVGVRSPSFKHVSHETEHLTPHMSADSVHLCLCAIAGNGAWSRSGSHAPAQSVPSPQCDRPLASHVQASLSLAVALVISVKSSPFRCKACLPRRCSCSSGFAHRRMVAISVHVRSAWLSSVSLAACWPTEASRAPCLVTL